MDMRIIMIILTIIFLEISRNNKITGGSLYTIINHGGRMGLIKPQF